MQITVNGKMQQITHGQLDAVLEELGYAHIRCVVEMNGNIINPNSYTTTIVTDADRLEIVSFVGGG